MVTVLPPSVPDIMLWCGRGVSISLPTGAFDTPLRAPQGSPIRLVASRKGFVDVFFDGIADRDNTPVSLENFPADAWHKEISPDDFAVIDDHDGRNIADADVRMADGRWVRSDRELCGVEIKVRAHDYETNVIRCDLTLPPPYTIRLSKKEGKAKFPVELANGRIGHITVTGVGVTPSDSGLKGYELRDGRLIFAQPQDNATVPATEIPDEETASSSSSHTSSAVLFLTGFFTGILVMLAALLVWIFFG